MVSLRVRYTDSGLYVSLMQCIVSLKVRDWKVS